MEKCHICKHNVGDKKGSHIVPHFLIKRIDSESEKKERDKELGFIIEPNQTTSYFGRAVLPEKLEEIYGEIDDKLIDENRIHGVVDYYFCSNCEKRLSVLEDVYSNTLKNDVDSKEEYFSTKESFIGFLFWISIIWRLSIQDGSGFKLKPKVEKHLGRIINRYLQDKASDIKPEENDNDLHDIGYKILRSPNYSEKNSTLMHWQPSYERPYSLMIDEFIVFLYMKNSYLKGMILDFYGSEKYKQDAPYNTPYDREKVLPIKHDDFQAIFTRVTNFAALIKLETLNSNLDAIHRKLGGRGKYMNQKMKDEIKFKIAHSEEKLGKRHTIQEQSRIIFEVISKYHKVE